MADYERVERAIGFLQRNAQAQPSLADVAAEVGLSPHHFQRLFLRWAGVSPKRFLQFLTAEHAKRLLRESRPVLDATYAVGLSSPGRLHDLLVSVEAMTPGEYKERAAGLEISFGIHETPFGNCLLALTGRGVCTLWFVDDVASATARLHEEWPVARVVEDRAASGKAVAEIFGGARLPLHVRGTNFQLKVWSALLAIPEGAVVSYGDLARSLGMPAAARAVAGAVGSNPVAYLIPCHRVLRASGALGGYRWGMARKRAMLGREFGRPRQANG